MIWLRVKVNRTRLCTAAHFARNIIKYQKGRESGLSSTTFMHVRPEMYDSLFVIYTSL